MNLKPNWVFSYYTALIEMLRKPDLVTAWRFFGDIHPIRFWLSKAQSARVCAVSKNANVFTDRLAMHARYNTEFSLFHKELDLPHWIENVAEEPGLVF